MFDATHYRKNFLKQKHYLRLIEDLKVMIEAVQADGENLSEGRDLLKCMGCGAFEGTGAEADACKGAEPADCVAAGSFIIIEAKQKVFHQDSQAQKINVYTFICPVCGLYQNGLIKGRPA